MIEEKELDALRSEVADILSDKRFLHSLGVERAALDIGKHCLPDKLAELSASELPAVQYFMEKIVPVYLKSLDELELPKE